MEGPSSEWQSVSLPYPVPQILARMKSPLIFSVALPHSQIFNLICLFHLLEDVSANTMDHALMENGFNEQQITIQLQSSPVFTGLLPLCLLAGIDPIPSRLLSLPDCLRFRKNHQVRTFRSQRRW